jgi:hypothetical protein
MRIAKDNGKIGLYETNKVRIYKPVSGTMSVGYDNSTPGPTNDHYFLVKYKFDNIYTGGEMAIRIPIVTSGTADIQQRLSPATDPNRTELQIWKYSVVGENPTYGFNNYIANVASKWGTRSTSTYVEFFTTDSTAIAGLNTTEYFWFGIQFRTSTNSFYRGILSYYEGNKNCQLRRYLNFSIKDWDLTIEVIDTSHA